MVSESGLILTLTVTAWFHHDVQARIQDFGQGFQWSFDPKGGG